GLELVETIVGREPADEFTIGDARRILHRTRRADRHDEALVLEPRPLDRPRLDEIDLDRGRRGDFDGDPAEFTVALPAVAIAEKEIGALCLHRKVRDRAR